MRQKAEASRRARSSPGIGEALCPERTWHNSGTENLARRLGCSKGEQCTMRLEKQAETSYLVKGREEDDGSETRRGNIDRKVNEQIPEIFRR